MPALVWRYGADAQAAAEVEVARQGFPADVLARNNVHFNEGAIGLALPVAIALGSLLIIILLALPSASAHFR